jgi:hypothetical protein
MTDNDTQYGNILLLDRELPRGEPEHHRVRTRRPSVLGSNQRS